MINLKRIYPECNADTLLVQLILGRGFPNHCKNIHKVASALEDFSNNNLFIIGVVDNDKFKNIPTYIKSFKVHEDKEKEEKLTILHFPGTQKYIIKLHPAFEKWILFVAESCEVDYKDFGFDSMEKFINAAKDDEVYDNREFKKFVNAVIMKNPPAIQTIKSWLNKVDNDN